MAKLKIDPRLRQQVERVGASDASVEAVFTLKPSISGKVVPEPEETAKIATSVLRRAEKASGLRPLRVNVFKNMGSFAVSAHPSFLKELMTQPEIAGGISNRSEPDEPSAAIPRRRPRSVAAKKR